MSHSKAEATLRARTRTGQALVELAFILPLLLVLFSLIVNFGYYLFSRVTVNNAVRNACRLASLNSSTSQQIAQRVADASVGVVIPAGATTITVNPTDTSLPNSPPTVTVTVRFMQNFVWGQDFGGLQVGSTFTTVITTYNAIPASSAKLFPTFSSGTF